MENIIYLCAGPDVCNSSEDETEMSCQFLVPRPEVFDGPLRRPILRISMLFPPLSKQQQSQMHCFANPPRMTKEIFHLVKIC